MVNSVNLDDKVAIVIGGSSGIGEAISLGLARKGAFVIPTSRTEDKIKNTVSKIRKFGRKTIICPTDVTKREQINNLVNIVINEFGKIDILVNSAGITISKPLEKLTEAEWDRIISVNLKGIFLSSQIIGKEMIKRKKGKIINIASIASYVALNNEVAYCASKGGVLQFTRALAREWAKYNIQVNAIAPGFILTPLNKTALEDNPERLSAIKERTPMGRIGHVEDIVGAALYLASSNSKFTTGSTITVDGGFIIQGL